MNCGCQSKFSNVCKGECKILLHLHFCEFHIISISGLTKIAYGTKKRDETNKKIETYILENIYPITLHTCVFHRLAWKFIFFYSFEMFENVIFFYQMMYLCSVSLHTQ